MKSHLQFLEIATPADRKTRIWEVRTRNIALLGSVRWWAAWRRYCFVPVGNTLFDAECLGEITEFIKTQMQNRQNAFEAMKQTQA